MPSWKVWPSPPPRVRPFRVELVICDITGLPLDGVQVVGGGSAMVQVQWSGGGGRRLAFARQAAERNCTAPRRVQPDGAVSWWEGFPHECKLKTAGPQRGFKSWIVKLEIHGFGEISKYSSSILGKTQLDVSVFASSGEERSMRSIPVKCRIRGFSGEAELRVAFKISDPHIKSGAASTFARASSLRGVSCSAFPQTDSGPVWRPSVDSKCSANGWESSSAAGSPSKEETELNSGKPVAERFSLVKDFGRKLGNGEEKRMGKRPQEIHHFPPHLSRTHSLGRFSWTKGRLGSKSTKHPKEGPLLYEAAGDGGVGDTDPHWRAQQSGCVAASSPSPPGAQEEHPVLRFEEEGQFEIGSWEERTVASRDGRLELVTEVFLASIDQRSEKVAGESACSVLAAVIADWLHRNPGALPLRCQFDDLVREGSCLWRRLCADETHVEKFFDRHFDLDTVLGANVRPLAVVTGMSYVGFLGMEAAPGGFEYLDGAMSFDGVWDELLCAEAGEERVYIAGWNDHFFVLKVEEEAVCLIDTLGERLIEGCNQAYILKFDKGSRVYMTGAEEEEPTSPEGGEQGQCSTSGSHDQEEEGRGQKVGSSSEGRRVVCEGLGACKEFIKGFLAAVPLRELRGDMERGLVGEAHLHRLLQIEFHYTSPL